MLFVRRLLLTATLAALLCATAVVAGRALEGDGRHAAATGVESGREQVRATNGPTAAQRPTSSPTPAQPRSSDRTPRAPAPDPATGPAPGSATGPELTPGPQLLGPGDESREVRELQARLKQIAWFAADVTGHYGEVTEAAVRGFQAKREIPVTGAVDQRTLDRLHAMTTEPTEGELTNSVNVNPPGALDPRCREGRVLCVDKTSRTLRWVVDGAVRQTLDVRFGASATPTREGVFSVYVKSEHHVSRLFGSAMPFAMFFDGGQAVHYSSDFAAVGYAGASHGCVNVRDYAGIQRLFGQVHTGDRVVVYWS